VRQRGSRTRSTAVAAVREGRVGLLLPKAEETDDLAAVQVPQEATCEAQPCFKGKVFLAFACPTRWEGEEEEGDEGNAGQRVQAALVW